MVCIWSTCTDTHPGPTFDLTIKLLDFFRLIEYFFVLDLVKANNFYNLQAALYYYLTLSVVKYQTKYYKYKMWDWD